MPCVVQRSIENVRTSVHKSCTQVRSAGTANRNRSAAGHTCYWGHASAPHPVAKRAPHGCPPQLFYCKEVAHSGDAQCATNTGRDHHQHIITAAARGATLAEPTVMGRRTPRARHAQRRAPHLRNIKYPCVAHHKTRQVPQHTADTGGGRHAARAARSSRAPQM